MPSPKLSIVIPVFNEKETVIKVLEAIRAVPIEKEVIVVDDGSTDGTRPLLHAWLRQHAEFKIIFHRKNRGKGSAVAEGFKAATGDAVIIQDADLEYDPHDYPKLLRAYEKPGVQVVYGSRFLKTRKSTSFWHWSVNAFLTSLTNILYGSRLTDMETCYKLMKRDVAKSLHVSSQGFEIEPEITAKLLKAGHSIAEVPISYHGRSYHDGKKINWKDGIKTVWALLAYRFWR